MAADVLIVPSMIQEQPKAFMGNSPYERKAVLG